MSAVTIRAREELEVEPPPSTSTATPNRWFSSFPSFGTWQPRRAAAAAPTPGHIPPSATAAASAAAAGALPSAMPVPTKPLRSGRKIQSVGNRCALPLSMRYPAAAPLLCGWMPL